MTAVCGMTSTCPATIREALRCSLLYTDVDTHMHAYTCTQQGVLRKSKCKHVKVRGQLPGVSSYSGIWGLNSDHQAQQQLLLTSLSFLLIKAFKYSFPNSQHPPPTTALFLCYFSYSMLLYCTILNRSCTVKDYRTESLKHKY